MSKVTRMYFDVSFCLGGFADERRKEKMWIVYESFNRGSGSRTALVCQSKKKDWKLSVNLKVMK